MKAIQVFDTNLTLIGEIACYKSLRLCRRFREVGDFEMVIPLSHPMADRLIRDRILCPVGARQKSMIIEAVTRSTGEDTLVVKGYTLSGILRRRICIPPNTGDGAYGYDRIVAEAESVMRHYVYQNVIAPLSEARRMDCIALEEENGMRGRQNVPWSARFEQLDELLASIGVFCDAGYAIIPDLEKRKLVFTFLNGRDKTGEEGNERVTFGVHMGNVNDSTELENAQQAKNAAIVGGVGEDEDRLILSVCPGGEEGLGRREMYVDAGSQEDPQELVYEGERRLAEKAMEHVIRADVLDTPSCRYGVHWDLGDKVTVTAYGAQMNARITQVQECHEADKPVQLEVVFGDPAGGIEKIIREKTRFAVR